jgi:hypothetical protein
MERRAEHLGAASNASAKSIRKSMVPFLLEGKYPKEVCMMQKLVSDLQGDSIFATDGEAGSLVVVAPSAISAIDWESVRLSRDEIERSAPLRA